MAVEYNILDEKWTLVTEFGQLVFDTQEEALMTQRNVDWLNQLQETAKEFYDAAKKAEKMLAQWNDIYTAIVTEEELGITSIIGTTHTFDAPIGELTNSRLATVLLVMEYWTSFPTLFDTYEANIVALATVE